MTQQNKAGIFFGAVLALALLSYLFFSTKNETIRYLPEADQGKNNKTEEINQLEKISQVEIESNYKKNMKKVIADFETKVLLLEPEDKESEEAEEFATSSLAKKQEELEKAVDNISELKVSVMEMIVPDDYRDLHLSLVKELSDMKEAILQDGQFDKEALLAIVEQSKIKDFEQE